VAITPALAEAAKVGAARAGDAPACIAAIANRTAACARVGFPWARSVPPALFAPERVRLACSVLLTGAEATSATDEACTPPATTCLSGLACLIDTCAPAGRLDDACTPSNPCVDGVTCGSTDFVCHAPTNASLGGPCSDASDCRLCLVCAGSKCDAARSNPGLYVERHSPNRVSAETCQIYTTL